MIPDISSVFPGWKVIALVGEGSFGKVYKCAKNELGIEITAALKVISIPQNKSEIATIRHEGMSDEAARSYFQDMVDDFTNEIKVMLALKGAPNVVTVENYKIVEHQDEIGWDIYIFMEFLSTFTKHSTTVDMNEKEVRRFGMDICNGLEICAKKNIIHRDIKPDNLFVDEYGNYKLGDFGVARRLEGTTNAMSKKGTYSYMAPEVFFGRKYDNRADIYSLGMVMYKLLNRKREPFTDLNKEYISYQEREQAVERRRNGERLPPPVDASPEMAGIILKACAYNPADRFANAAEFKAALERLGTVNLNGTVGGQSTVSRPVPPVAPKPPVQPGPPMPPKPPVRPGTVAPPKPPVAPRPQAAPKPPVAPPPAPQGRPAQTPPRAPAPQKAQPQKKTNKLIFIIPAILIFALIAVILIFVISGSNGSSPDSPGRNNRNESSQTENSGSSGESSVELNFTGNRTVAAGKRNVAVIKADGTVIASGDNDNNQCNVGSWANIVALASGDDQIIGLRGDGTVVATGYNDYGECNVESWTDIAVIASGDDYHTIGVKSDGTVVATGSDSYGQCSGVSSWTEIISVAGGKYHTVGLRADGTVVAVGDNSQGQCDVSGWTDIVSISAAGNHTVGVKADGTVVTAGYNDYGELLVDSWTNIVYVVCEYDQTIGDTGDGKMIFAGYNDSGEGNVEDWVSVSSAATSGFCTIFVDLAGYVWVFGDDSYGQMDHSSVGGMMVE